MRLVKSGRSCRPRLMGLTGAPFCSKTSTAIGGNSALTKAVPTAELMMPSQEATSPDPASTMYRASSAERDRK